MKIKTSTTSSTSGGIGTCLLVMSVAMLCQLPNMSIALVR